MFHGSPGISGSPQNSVLAGSIDAPYGGDTATVREHWAGAERIHSLPYGTCG